MLTLIEFFLRISKYLLLPEIEGCTVNYRPRGFFFPSIYGPSAKREGHKSKGKKRRSITYGADRENEVSKHQLIESIPSFALIFRPFLANLLYVRC